MDSGAEILNEVHGELVRYVVFPSDEAADAVALWVAATHAQAAWEHATRLVLSSPIKRCGKTRAQEVARELVHRPLATVNISTAALVRSLDPDEPPTLILDEADSVFGTKTKDERTEALRGILNAGHSRGWPYVRWDATARQREESPTFAMALLGGIGSMPDTIEDRAIVVPMRRRAPGERVAQFRRRRAVPPLRELRERLHEWVRGRLDELAEAEPEVPAEDRDADVWEPLVAVADAAGGDWPERARRACTALCTDVEGDEATAGERLLVDLHEVWGDAEYLSTATILDRLHGIEEAPWGDWFGRPLGPRDLARLLRPYGVQSRSIREAGASSTAKGYARRDLSDPWARYTRPDVTSGTSDTEGDNRRSETVPDIEAPSDTQAAQGPTCENGGSVSDVSDVPDGRLEGANGEAECCEGGSLLPRCSLCPRSPTYYAPADT